ncbi:MAG: lactonase family protein [Candidatus Dormibacteraceae bacterium]
MPDPATVSLLAGTYTPPGGHGEGVLLLGLDTENGTLHRVGATGGIANPSFLALSPSGAAAYAVSEIDVVERRETGSLVSLAMGAGAPVVTATVETGSRGPCHVAVSPDGRHAIVSNYAGGAISVLELGPDGRAVGRTDLVQHTGSGVDPDRQAQAHVHSATFDERGERLLVCDLGLDLVRFYRLDGVTGQLAALPELDIRTPAGTGPRHLDFDPGGRRLYLAGELASTLVVYAYDPDSGRTEELQVLSTLGDAVPSERNYPADVHVHPTGRFVYLSNRGLDSIAIFGIDGADGRVTLLGNHPSGGQWPRNFAIDPTGRLLLSANQRSDTIVPYWIDQATGGLRPAGEPLQVGSPSCLRFIRS